jgi:collagenase-like PrtC family protease
MDYCVVHCALSRLSDTSQYIKSRWIRPEDIHIYEEIGIDFFKIGGRAMPTDWIINATMAYSLLHYQGNLYDILNVLTPKIKDVEASPSSVQIATVAALPKAYIDNQALEGFIEFFKKQDCSSGCAHCDYCQKIAGEVLRLDHREVDGYIAGLKSFLDDLTSSRIFHPVSTRR